MEFVGFRVQRIYVIQRWPKAKIQALDNGNIPLSLLYLLILFLFYIRDDYF